MVVPMSPRLASAMTSSPATGGGDHRLEGGQAGRPVALEEGDLGLDHRDDAGEGLEAAQAEVAEAVRPIGQSPLVQQTAEGSMPAHNGPVAATAAATRARNPPSVPPRSRHGPAP